MKPAGHAALGASPRDSPRSPCGCRRGGEQASLVGAGGAASGRTARGRLSGKPWCCGVCSPCPQAAGGTRSPDGLGPSSQVQGGRRPLLCLLLPVCCPWPRGFA